MKNTTKITGFSMLIIFLASVGLAIYAFNHPEASYGAKLFTLVPLVMAGLLGIPLYFWAKWLDKTHKIK